MQAQVIINADDFAYSDGINKGIQIAYEEGILTSTTVLGNLVTISLPNLSNHSGLEKEHLGIGVHLNLTFGKPLSSSWNQQSFSRPFKESNTDKEWQKKSWEEYISQLDEKQIEEEFSLQIERMHSFFGNIDHIDSHHGIASYPPADIAYENVAQKYHLAVRPLSPFSEKVVYGGDFVIDTASITSFRKKEIKTIDSVNMSYWHNLPNPIEAFCNDLATIQPNEVREYMFHPAIDESRGSWRLKDLRILTDRKVIDTIKALGIQLTTYNRSAN